MARRISTPASEARKSRRIAERKRNDARKLARADKSRARVAFGGAR